MDGLQTLNDSPFQVSVPACKCEMPDDMSLMLYESHAHAKKTEKKSAYASALEAFVPLIAKYDDEQERNAINSTLEKMQEYFAAV